MQNTISWLFIIFFFFFFRAKNLSLKIVRLCFTATHKRDVLYIGSDLNCCIFLFKYQHWGTPLAYCIASSSACECPSWRPSTDHWTRAVIWHCPPGVISWWGFFNSCLYHTSCASLLSSHNMRPWCWSHLKDLLNGCWKFSLKSPCPHSCALHIKPDTFCFCFFLHSRLSECIGFVVLTELHTHTSVVCY